MPAYRPYAPAVPSQQPQPRSENAPTILKSIDNIGKGSEIPTEKKRKSEDFDGILTSYFTIPTIPSVRKFCRDGMLGESCRKRIQSFLKDHQPLQKLIERSKFLVSDVQSEMTVALKTALRGSRKRARTTIVEGVDSPY